MPVNSNKLKIALFVCVPLFFSLEYFIFGPYSYVKVIDEADSIIPRALALKTLIRDFGIFYWFPNLVCGVDRLANEIIIPRLSIQFLFIEPAWLGYQLFKLAHYYIATLSMYYFSRRYLKLNFTASLLSSILFCIYLDDHLYTALCVALFPVVLSIMQFITHQNFVKRYFIVLMVGVLCSFISSPSNIAPGIIIFLLVWFRLIDTENFHAVFFPVILLSLFIGIFHSNLLFAQLSNMNCSHRQLIDNSQFFFNIGPIYVRLLNYALKPYFACYLLALFIIVLRIKTNTTFKRLTTIFLSSQALLVNLPLIKELIKNVSPAFASYSFHWVVWFTPFWAVLFAGESFHILLTQAPTIIRINKSKIAIAAIVLCMSIALVQNVATRVINIAHWSSVGGFVKQFEIDAFKNLKEVEPKPFRVCTFNRYLHPSILNAYNLESVDGYANLYSIRYKYFWRAVIDKVLRQRPRIADYFDNWGNRVYLLEFVRTR